MDQTSTGPAGGRCWKILKRHLAFAALFAGAACPGVPALALDPTPVCPRVQTAFLDDSQWLGPLAHATTAAPLRILAIGSSSTQGIGASAPLFAYPAQLRSHLLTVWGICADVDNAGVGGERVAFTEMRLEKALKTYKPDLVIWQLGTNDAVTGEDESVFRILLQKGISAVRQAKAGLVLLDPQFYPKIRDLPRYERFVKIIADLGDQYHVPVFSRYALMKAWAGSSQDVLKSMLSADGFHMSDRGYVCLAQELAREMAKQWGRVRIIASDSTPGSKLAAPEKPEADLHPHPAAAAEKEPSS